MTGIRQVVSALLLLAALANVSNTEKILAVFPFPATSHMFIMDTLVNGLAAKGHEVTVITAVPQKNPHKNIKQIDLQFSKETMMSNTIAHNLFEMGAMNIVTKTMMLFGIGSSICDAILSKPHVQEYIKTSKDKYDAVIVEAFFNECMLGFAHAFDAPIIQVCPFGGTEFMTNAMGNPHNYAYNPDFQLNFGTHMTFIERLQNTLLKVFVKVMAEIMYIPAQNAAVQKYFAGTGKGPVPHITELQEKTSLLLLNSHFSLSYAKPYVPNIVEVGGMHIKPPKKLPDDLQKFLDSAKDGVIYFSMGSNLKSSDMPAAKRDALLQAFSSLKQKVLWKWEEDNLPGQPQNVKLSKWFPQADLLGHPNIKLFITHGGLLSTEESVYHGKPVIGIPIFGDQEMNMMQSVNAGYGYLLPFQDITNETVTKAINTVLGNPKYKEKAEKISQLFRDQIRPPLETAVFWSEYVMRHKGAPHMRSAALDLAWYQYHLLDVLALIFTVEALILAILFVVLRAIVRRCLPKKKVADKKKRN